MISIFKRSLVILEETLDQNIFFKNYSPILYFGHIEKSKIATLGINPSNIEFENYGSIEILGSKRRFHSLSSLNLTEWRSFGKEHWNQIEFSFSNYFNNNPYNNWFKRLDILFRNTPYSYYFPYSNICHLDLVPFASKKKWSHLNLNVRNTLLDESKNILISILQESNISFLLLNGRTVVNQFENLFGSIECIREESLDLLNKRTIVKGYLFEGKIKIGNKIIQVLGFNHNIQSSFGITQSIIENLNSIIKNRIEENVDM